MQTVTLTLIVPVYNEQESVGIFLEKIDATFAELTDILLEIIFVNDGSNDNTLEKLRHLQKNDPRLVIIDLSRNFGKEAALSAGICQSSGDITVPIDSDLQDPPEVIPEMIALWRQGYEVVIGRRADRNEDSWIKRVTASLFYRIHNIIGNHQLPIDCGDFRLMDRRVVEALRSLSESQRFMKGLFAWVGFRTTIVDYKRKKREQGSSKFNGWKLWNLALEGFTSFSTAPLRIWTYIGASIALLSFLFAASVAIRVAIFGVDVPGYASLIVAIAFFSGLQLMGIGMLGEYLGRTYIEAKRRPVFVVRQIYTHTDNSLLSPGSHAPPTVRNT